MMNNQQYGWKLLAHCQNLQMFEGMMEKGIVDWGLVQKRKRVEELEELQIANVDSGEELEAVAAIQMEEEVLENRDHCLRETMRRIPCFWGSAWGLSLHETLVMLGFSQNGPKVKPTDRLRRLEQTSHSPTYTSTLGLLIKIRRFSTKIGEGN